MYLDRDHGELCIPIYKCPSHDWVRAVAGCCEAQGYEIKRNRYNLRVWKGDQRARVTSDIEYVEAIQLALEHLGAVKGKQYVGLTPVRLYFQNGSETPSAEREATLLGAHRKPKTNPSRIIDGIIALGHALAQSGGFEHLKGEREMASDNIISEKAKNFFHEVRIARNNWTHEGKLPSEQLLKRLVNKLDNSNPVTRPIL